MKEILKIEIKRNNRGGGLAVVLYGITLLLILIFTAVNMVNSKVIENGYNSLRDSIQSASAGSVIHLLTTDRAESGGVAQQQASVIQEAQYDIYLQLALGYLINRNENATQKETIVQTGEINNFIKLDHQKVVNSTMALLDNGVSRRQGTTINDTKYYKIMMFFIEPYQHENGEKFFDIIAYGNGDYDCATNNIKEQLARTVVESSEERDMAAVYENIQQKISNIVNCTDSSMEDKEAYATKESFWINLNAEGTANEKIRKMETYPHYLIVVKDFALPTIFDKKTNTNDTTTATSFIKQLFPQTDPKKQEKTTLKKPMCALNTGKTQRQIEEAGWDKKR